MSTLRQAARLKDVALLAGVSVKTVSNVVNEYPYVRPGTRVRVQQAIDELGYRPNLSARKLRSGRSGVIALALPELDAPYFSDLAHHIVRAAVARGWTVLVDETEGVPERERTAAAGIRGHLIDGAILSPVALDASDVAQYSSGIPLVLLGERVGSSGMADHVAIDNAVAAADVTRHLLETGRTRIAVLGHQDPPFDHTARLRIAGYRTALDAAGVPFDPQLVLPAETWRRGTGAEGARRLLTANRLPDAVFCLNDLLALGAIRAFADAGLRVPDDLAVVGFDDIEESRFATPTLTTIAPDKEALAEQAVDRLARRLTEGPEMPPQEVVIGHRLEVRGSSGT